VQLLDSDLARKHALLVLGDEIHIGPQRVEAGLHLGEHCAGDLADHRQAVAAADVPTQRGLSGGVAPDEVDPHRPSIYGMPLTSKSWTAKAAKSHPAMT
jgi:hypothetical protein